MTDSQASKRFAATSRRPRPTESAELNGHASVLDLLRLGCLDPRRGPSLGGGLTCLLFPGASEAVMADAWEEIRRLAADFQRAQFAEAVQRCWSPPVWSRPRPTRDAASHSRAVPGRGGSPGSGCR